MPIARTAAKKIASLVFNEQASIKLDDEQADKFIQETLKMTALTRILSAILRVVLLWEVLL
ncbi:hypothetical protein SMIM3I_00185 [Streptococcus mitis]|uniref:Uncharacterized protein n=1 Tax=Streptococcus mitis TaxID=28037 RepID=A0A150NN40_STRMT|nr:hypothetical protein SMIM3I_00185 [Streptococcus mitis]